MTITLTVSDVRRALHQADGFQTTGDGTPSTSLLGTMFHRVVGDLLRDDSRHRIESIVRDLEPELAEWQRVVTEYAYDQLLGPQLTVQAASLRHQGTQVLDLWTAVQDVVQWLTAMWWEITEQGTRDANQSDWLWAERSVSLDLYQPGWKEHVTLVGQIDAVLRIPNHDRWCVLEWKLGQTSPLLDHGQACLYHLILTGTNEPRSSSAIAVVSFHPKRSESLFESHDIGKAQASLMELIGRLADVLPTTPVGVNQEPEVLRRTSVEPDSKQNHGRATQPTIRVSEPSAEWLSKTQDDILRVLRKFGAPCRAIKPPTVGPTFVRFFVFPESSIKRKKVESAAEELHLHLGLASVPVIDTIDGAITVDLPNPNRVAFPFSQLLPFLPAVDRLLGCPRIPVGLDLNGDLKWCDLATESPHLLVVGTPGSGKSQWLRTAVASLTQTNTPETLQLLLIDPKQNAFAFAAESPFLRQPIVVPGKDRDVSEILRELVTLMDERNAMLAESRSQSLADHVRKTGLPEQRIICFCDEYADLLDGSDKSEKAAIERQFKRIAQVGRAAGLHLILATQQPRTQILSPAIRSLIDCRVVLRVSSALESRVALEASGAERLLGRGDLLFKSIGTVRLQGSWLPENEEELILESAKS